MITVRKQPHGLSGQTELRAPYCLSDFSDTRIQAEKRTGKTKRGGKKSQCALTHTLKVALPRLMKPFGGRPTDESGFSALTKDLGARVTTGTWLINAQTYSAQ